MTDRQHYSPMGKKVSHYRSIKTKGGVIPIKKVELSHFAEANQATDRNEIINHRRRTNEKRC